MTIVQNIDAKAWLSLKARMDEWTETPIQYPYGNLKPQASQAFLLVDTARLESDVESTDYQCGMDQQGFLNVRVMTPLQWDYAASSGLLGRFVTHMQAGTILDYQDAQVTIIRTVAQGTPSLEVSWNRQDVRIYWRSWG